MMKDPDNHDDVEKTVRIEVDPDDSGEFAEKTVRFERGPDAGSLDKADSYFGEHISSDTGRKLNAALERTGQYSSGDENAGEAGDSEPGGQSGPGGPGLGEADFEVAAISYRTCRHEGAGLERNDLRKRAVDPVATDDEVSGVRRAGPSCPIAG